MHRIFGGAKPTPLVILQKLHEKDFSDTYFDRYHHYLSRENDVVRIGILTSSLEGRMDFNLWRVSSWPIFTSSKISELSRLKYEVSCGEKEHRVREYIFDTIMEHTADDIRKDVVEAIVFNPEHSYRDIVEYILGL